MEGGGGVDVDGGGGETLKWRGVDVEGGGETLRWREGGVDVDGGGGRH